MTASSGRPRRGEHDDRRVRRQRVEQRELHLGEHEPARRVADQHRPRPAGGRHREVLRVDHVHAGHRVAAEPRPGEVEERQPGHHLDLEVGAGRVAQQRHRALGDAGVAGHRVDDLAVLARRRDEPRRRSPGRGRRTSRRRRTRRRTTPTASPAASSSAAAGWRRVRRYRCGIRSYADRATGSIRSTPAGPSPTTTTRAAVTARRARSCCSVSLDDCPVPGAAGRVVDGVADGRLRTFFGVGGLIVNELPDRWSVPKRGLTVDLRLLDELAEHRRERVVGLHRREHQRAGVLRA